MGPLAGYNSRIQSQRETALILVNADRGNTNEVMMRGSQIAYVTDLTGFVCARANERIVLEERKLRLGRQSRAPAWDRRAKGRASLLRRDRKFLIHNDV